MKRLGGPPFNQCLQQVEDNPEWRDVKFANLRYRRLDFVNAAVGTDDDRVEGTYQTYYG